MMSIVIEGAPKFNLAIVVLPHMSLVDYVEKVSDTNLSSITKYGISRMPLPLLDSSFFPTGFATCESPSSSWYFLRSCKSNSSGISFGCGIYQDLVLTSRMRGRRSALVSARDRDHRDVRVGQKKNH